MSTEEETSSDDLVPPYVYFKEQLTRTHHHFYLTGEILDPVMYIDMIHTIRNAAETDTIEIHLNTSGGNLSTGVQMINAIESSAAHVICILEGECYSLGTLLFLSADEFIVHDNCLMMFHNFSGGTNGKGHEQLSELNATSTWFTNLAREKYIPFLSESECELIFNGQDIWLQSSDVRERLTLMVTTLKLEATEDDN